MTYQEQKSNDRKRFTKYVERILAGTDEEAENLLREFPGYQTIPEVNMMTLPMIARLSGVRSVDHRHLYSVSHHYRIDRIAVKGRWGAGQESQGDIVSISWCMRKAGMDISPSKAMKFIGIRVGNNLMNLFPPRGILAILYGSCHARYKVRDMVESHYIDPLYAPVEEVVQPPAEAPQTLPEPAQTTQAVFTPEFVAQLVQVCVRESVAAALASRAAVENIHRAG